MAVMNGIPKAKLPSMQRVSPGVYRNAQGGMQTPTRGIPRAQLPAKPQQPASNPTAAVIPQAPENGGGNLPNANVDTSSWVQQPGAAPVPDLKALNAKRQKTLDEIHRRGGLAKTPGFATQLNDLNSQIRAIRNKPPAGAPPTGGPLIGNEVATGGPAIGAGEAPPADTSAVDAATKALYPSLNYQLPENYEGSPMYKFQMEQGNKALNRKLAQRGLLDSGAEIQATNELSQSVGAQESDRLRGDFQTEADRYERVSANEANRLQRDEDSNWNRRIDVVNTLLKQTPMNEAYSGTGRYADTAVTRGKAKASNTANNYNRVSAGGGRSQAPFVPPQASGPDYSQAELINAMLGNSSSRGNGNIVDSFFGSLFGG